MEADEKLKSVESQIVLMERGEINAISCPYCGEIAVPGEEKPLCCELLAKVVNAVIDRLESNERMELAGRIAGKITLDSLK